MTINVGVIGLGMGRHHAKQYEASPLANLVALCDVDERRLEEYRTLYPRARTYSSCEEMFAAGGLDAVSVALPNYLHDTVTIAALGAGLHVLCEKPMALDAPRAEAMLEAARAAGKQLMIHFNYRYQPASQWLKRYVDEGHLGSVYYARTRWLRASGVPKPGGWFGVKEFSGGGPVIDLGVHRLDLALWLMGYPRAVTVSASTYDLVGRRFAAGLGVRYDVEDLASALIRLDNGATLSMEASWVGGTDRREDMLTEIYGVEGAAIHRNVNEGYEFEALALQDCAGALTQVSPRRYPAACPSAVEDFVRCIHDDCPVEARAEHGLALMRIIDAIYRSAAEGCEVCLDG
jgi:predicted dehydrogenase